MLQNAPMLRKKCLNYNIVLFKTSFSIMFAKSIFKKTMLDLR